MSEHNQSIPSSKTEDILKIRAQLPSGVGASPDAMGALAWELEDDEAARFAYNIADQLKSLREETKE
jgi:hypothetical protein